MLVETMKNGNVVIRIHDDGYTGKNAEEIQAVIADYCRCVVEALQREKTA